MKRIDLNLPRLRTHALGRLRCLTLLAALALAARCSTRPAASAELQGLAELLGRTARSEVSTDAIAWEPSRGYWSDLLWGRPLLFLAKSAADARDLYRVRVRLSPEGFPLSAHRLHNLTQTPLGDDVGLRVQGAHAAFVTTRSGAIQGLSVLDLRGIPRHARPSGWLDRRLLALTSYQHTGSWQGIGWTDVVFDRAPAGGRLRVTADAVELELADAERSLRYDLRRARLSSLSGDLPHGARAVPSHYPLGPVLQRLTDTLDEEFGPLPASWLEQRLLALVDAFHRATYSRPASTAASAPPLREGPPVVDAASHAAARPDAPETARGTALTPFSREDHAWPPPPIPGEPRAGAYEGQWTPVAPAWLPRLQSPSGANAPEYFYRATLRPDPERPYAELMLIAADMRQLEMDVEAGYESPKAVTGPRGVGRLAYDVPTLQRVVATFDGGIRAPQAGYGMMVRGRVLVPPRAGSASFVLNHSGQAGLGTWPRDTNTAEGLVSFRQSLEPLIEGGVAQPTQQRSWGQPWAGDGMVTERSAVCLSKAGNLYYAWGEYLTASSLATGLTRAGCDYAVHLAMRPGGSRFVFTNIEQLSRGAMQLEVAHPGMEPDPARLLNGSARDFFVLKLKPQAFELGGVPWAIDRSTQPPGDWLPGVFRSAVSVAGIEVQLVAVAHGRAQWLLRPGDKERRPAQSSDESASPLQEVELSEVLFALGLGVGVGSKRPGLKTGKHWLIPPLDDYATLVFSESVPPRLLAPGTTRTAPDADYAVQLPLLAERGKRLPTLGEPGEVRTRRALCWTPHGHFLLASVRYDSTDPAVHALLQLGCETVVQPDRGSDLASHLHWAGGGVSPRTRYDTSTLYALGAKPRSSVFHWSAGTRGPSPSH